MHRLAGGNLSEVMRIALTDGRELIAKTGPTAGAEVDMLRAIAATGAPAPEVLDAGDGLMVMAAAPSDGRLVGDAWGRLREALARLHISTAEAYGWPVDHAFGDVAIVNTRSDDWPKFWGAHRLLCHLPHVDAALGHRLERLAQRLGEHIPAQPPSALLHGDLWTGNVLAGGETVTLIDPACYFGDREVDVAMLRLFGHPPASFLEALDLAPGWREREPVYRLWPLLVHLRLFGSGYLGQVASTLDRLGV